MNLKYYYICRIIFTFIFLVSSTYIWFNVKDRSIYYNIDSLVKADVIEIKELEKLNDNDNEKKNYKLEIKNNNNIKEKYKVAIVPDIMSNNLSNNYVKYQINDGVIRSLNMDGVIYISELDEDKVDYLNLKIWISDTYNGNLNYNGRVIVS